MVYLLISTIAGVCWALCYKIALHRRCHPLAFMSVGFGASLLLVVEETM